jgi:PAS domain-containing protein
MNGRKRAAVARSPSNAIKRGIAQSPPSDASPADRQTTTKLIQALAALKLNTDEILQHKKQLEQVNGWFEIALDNMARGLSMFDSQQRLIVCNKVYREIYKRQMD